MKENLQFIGIFLLIVAFITGIIFAAFKISKISEDIKIVQPKEGIECAVVSRMFHTSIDCWKK